VRPECRLASLEWALALPAHPLAGRAGDRLGRGTGSSLEFMEHRDYVPGDDLRHVDWRAYARTDQLSVRLYREEVSPTVEVIVDTSVAMGVTPAKEQALRDLVDALGVWVGRAGGTTRAIKAGGERLDEQWDLTPGPRAALAPTAPLRPRTIRWLISDFLLPDDPAPTIRRLSAGAALLVVVQLLDPWELDPSLDGATTLVDAAVENRLDVHLRRDVLEVYRSRLGRLRSSLETAVRSAGGVPVTLRADTPAAMIRDGLFPAGLVEPA